MKNNNGQTPKTLVSVESFIFFIGVGILLINFYFFGYLEYLYQKNPWDENLLSNHCHGASRSAIGLSVLFFSSSLFSYLVFIRKTNLIFTIFIIVFFLGIGVFLLCPYIGDCSPITAKQRARNNLDEIARAIMAYEITTGKIYSDTSGKCLIGNYLQRLPLDPSGIPYSFASATELNGATVFSNGPDLTPGTIDDVIVSYKGPLALRTALISSFSLILHFNRTPQKVENNELDNFFEIPGKKFSELFKVAPEQYKLLNNRFLAFVWIHPNLTPATLSSDTISIKSALTDASGKPSIPFPVTINKPESTKYPLP